MAERDLKATPDAVGTPEGDNEFAPDQPLRPSAVEASVAGLETPRGSATIAYDQDHDDRASQGKGSGEPAGRDEPTGIEKVIDAISHGTLLP